MSELESTAVPTETQEGAVPQPVAQSDDIEGLRNKLSLVQGDNKRKGEANKAMERQIDELKAQLSDLRNSHNKQRQQAAIEREDYKQLWTDQGQTLNAEREEKEALQKKVIDLESAMQQQQIKTSVMNAFAQQGVHSPDQLFKLQSDNLRLKDDGEVVGFLGGVEVPLESFVQQLRSPGSGFDFYFQGTGARGMGAQSSSQAVNGQKPLSQMSFSEALALEVSDPQAFARLKAQQAG